MSMPAKRSERKQIGAKCGHVKRRLMRNEPLTGSLLEFALSVVGSSPWTDAIPEKLKSGQPLSEYELYLMVDIFLVDTWI